MLPKFISIPTANFILCFLQAEDEVEPGPSWKELPKKPQGKKVLPKPAPLEDEDEKAAEPPKAIAKRGKTAAPEEKKGGKKATGQFYR